jgi:hypothetical protein
MGSGMLKVRNGNGIEILHEMFELVGVAGYQRSQYQKKFELQVETFCESHYPNSICSKSELDILQDFEDEFRHRGKWELAWPREHGANGALTSLLTERDRFQRRWSSILY